MLASINKKTDLDKLFTERDTSKQTNDVYKLLGSCRDVNKNKIVFEKNTAMLKTSTSVDKLMKHDEKDKLKVISKAIFKVRNLSSFLLSLAEAINGENPSLCLLLLKKSLINYKKAQFETERLKSIDFTLFVKIKMIIEE